MPGSDASGILGAILAGGRSTRFGTDKANALLAGKPLLDHVIHAMRGQVQSLIVCGRPWPGITDVSDWPKRDKGPLGGLCAALRYAAANGYQMVLTAGCDVLPVPSNLGQMLGPAPAVVQGQPLFGLWPSSLAPKLARLLETGSNRSMRNWVTITSARSVAVGQTLFNLNTPADLQAYHDQLSINAPGAQSTPGA